MTTISFRIRAFSWAFGSERKLDFELGNVSLDALEKEILDSIEAVLEKYKEAKPDG